MSFSDEMKDLIAEHQLKKEEDATYRNSYLCAYKDLMVWMLEEESKLDGKFEPSIGLDGPESAAKAEIRAEYKKRLLQLKQKFRVT